MLINRRDAIKGFTFATLFSTRAFSQNRSNLPHRANMVAGKINVLLHGLFFMQVNDSDPEHCLFEIYAPDISDHHVFGGCWENVRELSQDLDWSSVGLRGKDKPTFTNSSPIPTDIDTSIPQFSRTDTKTGNLTGASKRKITLPWPQEVISLRRGDFDTYFRPNADSSVGQNITKYCKGQHSSALLGTIPCLVYEYDFPALPDTSWFPTLNYHFYHEPCSNPTGLGHINQALIEAKKIFEHPDNFDLGLLDSTSSDPVEPGDPNDQKVNGVEPDKDEISLNEDPYYSDWMSVCSHPNGQRKKSTHPKNKSKTYSRHRDLLNLNPANCPNFYIGG